MKLAIVKLRGGLGNQMFQYAAALYFAHTNSIKYLLTDNSLFLINKKTFTKRNFELDIFNLNIHSLCNFNTYLLRVFYFFLKKIKVLNIVNDTNFFLNSNSLIYLLDDYFQHESFFNSNTQLINDAFSFEHIIKNLDKINLINYTKIINTNAISIHIRRGDYLYLDNMNYHGVCNIEYYKKAVNFIEKKSTNITYFIFSDDIEWVKNNFTFINTNNINYIDNNINTSYIDMFLMSKCKHNIIANSTFSWWSAWLNTNINKIIIAPSNWFVTNSTINTIIPSHWVII